MCHVVLCVGVPPKIPVAMTTTWHLLLHPFSMSLLQCTSLPSFHPSHSPIILLLACVHELAFLATCWSPGGRCHVAIDFAPRARVCLPEEERDLYFLWCSDLVDAETAAGLITTSVHQTREGSRPNLTHRTRRVVDISEARGKRTALEKSLEARHEIYSHLQFGLNTQLSSLVGLECSGGHPQSSRDTRKVDGSVINPRRWSEPDFQLSLRMLDWAETDELLLQTTKQLNKQHVNLLGGKQNNTGGDHWRCTWDVNLGLWKYGATRPIRLIIGKKGS